MLIGLLSFLASGIITGFLSLKTNEVLMLVLGIPAGSLLMLWLLRRLPGDKILAVIIRRELGGLAGVLAGLLVGELVYGVLSFALPSLGEENISNIIMMIVANVTFGAFLADLLYGRSAVRLFSGVCAIVSMVLGVLLCIPTEISWIRFDQNLLLMLISYGTAAGLSIGLYSMRNRNTG